MAATPSPNFSFLSQHDPVLLQHATLAEQYVFRDPNTALIKLRQLAESLAKSVAAKVGIACGSEESFRDVEIGLFDRGLLDRRLRQIMRDIRLAGNVAAHSFQGERREALHKLKLVREIAIWCHKVIKNNKFRAGPFIPPPDPADADAILASELNELRESLAETQAKLEGIQLEKDQLAQRVANESAKAVEAYENEKAALEYATETEAELNRTRIEYETRLAELSKSKESAPAVEKEQVVKLSLQAASEIDLDEQATRKIIDRQMREAGWEADSTMLRHSRGTRPQKGRNLAIAEWPTGDGGFSDYVFFVGMTPIASVEAKRKRKNARSAMNQAQRYAKHMVVEDTHQTPGGPWGEYSLPFAFATNGNPFLRQLIDESGVWFRDTRRDVNHARPLISWYTPKGLKALLGMNVESADHKLTSTPSDYLPLRPYQRAAIEAVENSLKEGNRETLLAMATGTGKTRTCICLIYRLMKASRFKRVLFVVDRTSLGEQAAASFKELKLEQNQTFSGIYDVKELGDLEPDESTRLQVATIQAMVRRIKSGESDNNPIPIDSYDCIVVDECHRGYVHDQEMSDLELSYRDQEDFVSTYVRVLDYFDAVRIGLTATPALHTRNIFGPPVFTYSFQQAVFDGFLVDLSPPYLIKTELNQKGITWEPGEEVSVFNTSTKTIHSDTTEDQIKIEIEGFNKKAMVEGFNKVVCDVLAKQVPPNKPGKTLIFCVRDSHANAVVRLLNDSLEKVHGKKIDHRLVQKITGSIDDPSQTIKYFKKEKMPKYAVTVDLLTTGIDVPEIVNLVFLRRTNSRILFDQMIGRATRLCKNLYGDGIDKDCFNLYDAVGQYPAMQQYTDMRPVAVSPKTPMSKLVAFLHTQDDGEVLEDVHRQIVAKFTRKISTIEKKWPEDFTALAGAEPAVVAEQLRSMSPVEAKEWFSGKEDLVTALDKVRPGSEVYVYPGADKLIEVVREQRPEQRPDDYLESFEKYLREHASDLPAIELVTKRPRDLTRASLLELRAKLQLAGFSVDLLKQTTKNDANQVIAASIIGYIRHVMLDEPLLPLDQRVDSAISEVLGSQEWTGEQRRWLEIIGKQLKTEVLLDAEVFERGQFKRDGGFSRLNKVFGGRLSEVLRQIVDSMWRHAA